MILTIRFFALGALACICICAQNPADWPAYGRDPGGSKYSPLDQINTRNVNRLIRAWTYHSTEGGQWETTPLVVGGVMYFTTQRHRVVALDADTGKERWVFDPQNPGAGGRRGVSWWPGDGKIGPRIFLAGDHLYALDAVTGKLIPDFGDNGVVDLRAGITDNYPKALYAAGSPPAIYRNLVILGPATQEGPSKGPSGDPRAFDARTGKLVWRFHTVPQPGEPGNETWGPDGWKDRAGPSLWGGITVDNENGLLFLPTGNPADSFYGGDRKGQNLYANSVVALDAATGRLRWYFQLVHHDIYDYDVASPAALVEATMNGKRIPAVAEISKSALLYVLDRLTGKPVWGVEERPVPKSDMPGEESWPTQPFPLKPPALARLAMTKDEVSAISPETHDYCAAEFAKYKTLGPFTPFGLEPRLAFPSAIGGANWAGVSFDPKLGYIFVNTSSIGQTGLMAPTSPGSPILFSNLGAYGRFVDPDGHPCNQPPWGELSAVDTHTGNIAWRVPLGSYEELEAKGIRNTGAVNLGGSISTAGGLVFIAATNDHRFRAFDSRTGKEVWMTSLEASGNATPISFRGKSGKQYVVIVAGSSGRAAATIGVPRNATALKDRTADSVIAFTLP
jgi:quinoprotein glucose dehydrogenase